MVKLPFYNMIGDTPDSPIKQSGDYIQTFVPKVMSPGHFDMYSIASKYLKDFIPPASKLVKSTGKDFRLETVHQGFHKRPPIWGREIFLTIRYAIEVADSKSIVMKELEEWRESLLFAWKPKIPMRYNITDGSVELFVTLPFKVIKKANLVSPEFPVDSQTLNLNELNGYIQSLSENMKREIDQMRKKVQMLKYACSGNRSIQ